MKVYQSSSFERKTKKFTQQEKKILDKDIKKIVNNLFVGEEKRGDLKGIFVHKFRIKTTEYLLAYRSIDGDLELIMVGPHENYYRDLKIYLKSK